MSKSPKLRNWREYNQAWKRRGSILISLDAPYVESLYYDGRQKRGGKRRYSPVMYEYILTLKAMLRLPWRATMGLAESVLAQALGHKDRVVPDFGHASRECSKLECRLQPIGLKDGLELAFDSTGVNVYGTSGWHQRNYGQDALHRGRDQWKKIHVAIDLNSLQVVAVTYTDSNTNDCEVVEALCDEIQPEITSVRADGAYDTQQFRKILYERGAKDLIPPATTSKAQNELKKPPQIPKPYLALRDQTIQEIRSYPSFTEGLKAWKLQSGYHRRSQVEAFMARFKRLFGFSLQLKTETGRRNEIITKMNLLNRMTNLGKAVYAP